jgi:hypothetical protein
VALARRRESCGDDQADRARFRDLGDLPAVT